MKIILLTFSFAVGTYLFTEWYVTITEVTSLLLKAGLLIAGYLSTWIIIALVFWMAIKLPLWKLKRQTS